MGVKSQKYILDRELGNRYNTVGFNRFKKLLLSSKNKLREGIIVERGIDSIDSTYKIKQKLDTIYRISRKLVLSPKPYYEPKIKN